MIKKKHTSAPTHDVEKFVVRLPHGMRARIAEVSRLSHRSMNSEIVARLEDSLDSQMRIAEPQSPYPTGGAGLQAVDKTKQEDGSQEQLLLECFRRLSGTRRKALIEFLEGAPSDH